MWGCGGGALTQPLAELLGSANVVGVDPDLVALEACRARLPGVDVRVASAEALPFADGEFDAVLAQLVVSMMSDAYAGVREMSRVGPRWRRCRHVRVGLCLRNDAAADVLGCRRGARRGGREPRPGQNEASSPSPTS
jgi:SAM-dependent methyltransferase